MKLRPILAAIALASSACVVEAPLVVVEWALPPGGSGVVEAEFQIDRPVFREPLSRFQWEMGLTSVLEARSNTPVFSYFPGGGDETAIAQLELLTVRRFRLTVDQLPDRLPPPPYLLRAGVRGGDAVEPGWPTFVGEVEFGAPTVE
jgi:hypothetical protein